MVPIGLVARKARQMAVVGGAVVLFAAANAAAQEGTASAEAGFSPAPARLKLRVDAMAWYLGPGGELDIPSATGLADGGDMADDAEGRLHRFGFTTAQLDAYGVKELHVLEDVLRLRDRKTMRAVADRIAGKIGWVRNEDDDFDFLGAYYAGLRGRLESRLLMGRRRWVPVRC